MRMTSTGIELEAVVTNDRNCTIASTGTSTINTHKQKYHAVLGINLPPESVRSYNANVVNLLAN